MESQRRSRTLSPTHDAIPDVEGAIVMDANEAEPPSIIGYCMKTQREENIRAPVAAPGKTLRFRGSFLQNIGKIFPFADVYVHRIGDPVESDFELKGIILYKMRSVLDAQAIYRITLNKCDAANQNGIIWDPQHSGHDYSADDYCNLLELGKEKIIRQIPGKIYTFPDCVDLLGVPECCRQELQGFGSRVWSRREGVPKVWIGSNLQLEYVSKKIRFIMSP
ncbi:hypothetical protein N0V82_002093 [Gnomoniopsis sp. IMI 355080]|nr:hypothetical protein N0V82_002093 [Gnomoniopsis sp. IMI 355080]